MIDGCQFLFQDIDGIVYHVDEKGVEETRQWPASERIVAFVDGDEWNYAPKRFLYHPSVQIIIAASARGANGKWLKQVPVGMISVTHLAIKLWSPRELFLTGLALVLLALTHEIDVSLQDIPSSPRYFFRVAQRVDLIFRS